MTFAEAELASARAAAMLGRLGVGRGDRVALQLPNVPAFVAFYYGVLRLGAVVVPINPLLRGAETAYALEDSGARALLIPGASPSGPGEAPGVEVVAVGDPWADDRSRPRALRRSGRGRSEGDRGRSSTPRAPPGQPKGAELTHRNLGLNVREVVAALSLES